MTKKEELDYIYNKLPDNEVELSNMIFELRMKYNEFLIWKAESYRDIIQVKKITNYFSEITNLIERKIKELKGPNFWDQMMDIFK